MGAPDAKGRRDRIASGRGALASPFAAAFPRAVGPGLRTGPSTGRGRVRDAGRPARPRRRYRTAYSSSPTGSSHSLEVSVPGASKAMWLNQLSALAPCQCFTPAGITTTVPGTRL